MSVAIGTAHPSMFLGMPGSQIDADVHGGGDDHAPDGGRDRKCGACGVA